MKEKTKDFRHKYHATDSLVIELTEDSENYIFKIPKAITKHNPLTVDEFWIVTRLDDNKFLLSTEEV